MGTAASRWWLRGALAAALLAAAAVLAIAALPVGWLRGRVERALAEAVGAPVAIGRLERREAISLTPTIVVRDVRVAQPDWAGPGAMLTLREADARVPVWRALTGGFDPDHIRIRGLRADLIRDAQGRENWDASNDADSGDGRFALSDLAVEDAVIRIRDARRPLDVTLDLGFDRRGLRAHGAGRLRGRPVRVALAGAPLGGAGPWPFAARITGNALAMRLSGAMAVPLDVSRLAGTLSVRGDSLETVDAVVDAGLPATQPVVLTARLSRTAPDWRLRDIRATIGRSRLAGDLTIAKRDQRTRLTGAIRAATLDFDDLTDDTGLARGRARRARTGPRIVPATDIDIRDIDRLDVRVDLRADRLLWRKPAPFRTLATTAVLDRRLLTLQDIRVALDRGAMTGTVRVDARGSGLPRLALDLAVDRSSLGTFAGDLDVSAGLRGRAILVGRGRTVRQAVGASNGHVAVVVGAGTMPARMASFIGLDIGRGITSDRDDRTRLRCIVMRLEVAGGTGRLAPLVVDTTRSRADVTGTLDLASERLDWRLVGAPKRGSILRYDRPFPITGTIRRPSVIPPPGARSVGSVLGMLGRAIAGHQPPLAQDADCGRLAARAMR